MFVSANDVKVKGVSIFESLLEKAQEVVISVRGKNKFVVVDIERYEALQELELDKAYQETLQEVEAGDYQEVTVAEHLKALQHAIQADSNG